MNQEVFTLKRDAPELSPLLMEGALLRNGEYWAALPREVVCNANRVESVIFEVLRPNALARPSFWRRGAQAIRLESLTITFTPGLAILLLGRAKHWPCFFGFGCLALLGALFLQISVNLLNDVEDHLRLMDVPFSLPYGSLSSMGGSRVLQKGWFNARQMRTFGYGFLGVGVLFGLPAAIQSPEILFFVGAAGILGVFSYSNKPFGLKYRVWGDVLIFFLQGPLLAIGFSQALFHQFDRSVVCLGLFFGLAAWGVYFANHLQNIEIDPLKGFKTLAARIGFKNSRLFLAALYGLAYTSLWVGVIYEGLPLFLGISALFGVPWIVRFLLRLYKASGPSSALLGPLRADAARIHFFLGLFMSVGLFLASL